MDIPYKGYTIIPNSERQPDGRWLPVADLEANSRGVVTPKPPLRAAPREIRATHAEADAVAVKMAKAWIETIEREEDATPPTTHDEPRALTGASRPKATIENAEASPRIPPERRVQGARAEPPPRAKPIDTLGWPGLHQTIGLDTDEKVDRFTRLLAVHALLDRLVTLVLATKVAAGREPLFDATASLSFSSRVALAVSLNVVPSTAAESILEIDRVWNRWVHSKPTRGKPAWDVGGAVENIPQDACDKSLRKGLEAARGLMSALRAAAQET
jgi:hypothetical protein